MATVKCFEELRVWQDARGLVKEVYGAAKRGRFARDYGLRDQIQRASTSTMANIAEGFERGTKKEFIQFLNIAKGSNGEARSHLYVAFDQEYIDDKIFNTLREASLALSRRLSRFITYLDSFKGTTRVRKPQRT